MKALIVLTVLCCLALIVYAQSAPEWSWATSGGGTSLDQGEAITNDNAGNTYVTGWFRYSITFGDSTLSGYSSQSMFIVKYSPTGTLIMLKGVNGAVGEGIAVDNSGNILVGGYFQGTGIFGDHEIISSLTDVFVAKMDSAGNWLWAVSGGSSGHDYGMDMEIDTMGNAYIVGDFRNTATFGTHSITSAGDTDVFVAKVNSNGTWAWAVRGGGSSGDYGRAIAVRGGYCYITGTTKGGSFGSTTVSSSSTSFTLLGRITVNGSWIWAIRAGGTHANYGNAICVDANGHIYIVGDYYGTASFSGISVSTTAGYRNGFLAASSPMGLWYSVHSMGAEGMMMPMAVIGDNYGYRYVAGYYQYSPTLGDFTLPNATSNEIFLAKLSSTGQWDWVSKAGGTAADRTFGISLDGNGHCYVTGYFTGASSFGDYQITGPGSNDVFIARHGGVPLYLAPPEPLIEIIGSVVRVSWDPIAGAALYYVYVSDEPDPDDWGDPIAQTAELFIEESATQNKRFYHVIAQSD